MTEFMRKLAELVGFHSEYTNCFNQQVHASDEALRSLLSAMGYNLDDEPALAESIEQLSHKDWLRLLPPVHIAKLEQQEHSIEISLPDCEQQTIDWQIDLEDGAQVNGRVLKRELEQLAEQEIHGIRYRRYHLPLPAQAQGYHQLTISYADEQQRGHLIFAPKTCYSPNEAADYKMWGLAAQLYSLTSDNNWGMGDFGDLMQLVETSSSHGVSAIGLNPLHPLYQNNPAHRSPYSPTSRCFLNTLYIDVTKITGFNECRQAQTLVASDEFQQTLTHARDSKLIDYPAVAHLKYQVLELLYQQFVEQQVTKQSTEAKEFLAFKTEQGQDLQRLATFDALYEHFRNQDENCYGWKQWPTDFQNIHSDEVAKFQQENAGRIDYFCYLQWVAHQQLSAVTATAKKIGMPVGLYLDLAVGCDGSGVDVWSDRAVYVSGAAVGAPPDAMNSLGQDWGLTPINPVALQAQGYQPLVKALRANMQYAGALRIDHILGLMRQYWVAPGMKADEGVYITFPLEDILRIIALESRRNNCVVIGEDLGTVPEGFGEIMAAAGLLSYKVLFFERWESGLFMRPELYPEQSMVTVSTHDLPTLAGWWTGRDLEWRQELNLYPNLEMGQNDRSARVNDRQQLIAALQDMQVINSDRLPEQSPAKMNTELSIAVQKFMALAPSAIQLIPLEDMLENQEQVNIPGTIDEHPNWLQKLPVSIENLWQHQAMSAIADSMQQMRPKGAE